jgi:hypothetical protein
VKRSAITVFMSIVAAIAAIGLTPVIAYAADNNCNAGYSCLWHDRDYSGSPWFQDNDHGLYNTGFSHNDDASSVWTRRGDAQFFLYDNTGGDTDDGVACVPKGYAHARLDRVGWEDRVSSVASLPRLSAMWPRTRSSDRTEAGRWRRQSPWPR